MSRERYEKEIEEILERAGEPPADHPDRASGQAARRRRGSPAPQQGQSVRHFALKYQYALIAGIVLIVLGGVMSWLYFFLAGLVLVVAGYVIYYRAPRGGGGGSGGMTRTTRMWRGRPIDEEDPPGRRRGR